MSMHLDLSRFKGGVQHLERSYEPASFDLAGEDFRLTAPVELTADVRRDETKVRLTGQVTTTLECDCGRCLEPFAVPVAAKLDLLFVPAPTDGAKADEQETQEDDIGIAFLKDDVIDLGEVMREQFFLALPMKPLCKEDCLGLCPVCGGNRNRTPCTCRAEWVDPRFQALKDLSSR